ncbi:MAG: tachylectin-related carbohydrate-binding protein, partial [Nodosilinea sp.]
HKEDIMAEIAMSQVTDLADPKIRKIAERIALEARLTIEKVAASSAQPDAYPLASDEKSIEQILKSHFDTLPQSIQQAAATQAINLITAPAAERAARYGDLANVDITNAIAIDTQVQALPFPEDLKLPQDHPIVIFNRSHRELARPVLLRRQVMSKLELRIHKVKCVEETSGGGKDEISLGGTTVDETGDTEKVDPFRVRNDFEDGVEQIYSPPRQFASFDLTEGTGFPKSYFVTLVLSEIDNGGFPEVLDKLLMWVKEKVIAAVTTAIGTGAAIGSLAGPIGAAIGAAAGALLGWIIDFFKELWEDNVFAPATVRVDIPSYTPGDMTDSPEGIITYKGYGGEYQVTYDWHMYDPQSIMDSDQVPIPRPTPGIIYAIKRPSLDPVTGRWMGGQMLWYHALVTHLGGFSWAADSGKQVGKGWGSFKQVFSGGDGVIYAIQDNGDLLWYRHVGWRDGSGTWAADSGKQVGNGWGSFKQVFSGGDGIIYAIESRRLDPVTGRRTGGHLLWYRHDGWRDGSGTWAANSGARVGRSWEGFSTVFADSHGFIYGLQENGVLLWYRHDGRDEGSFTWTAGSGKQVGNGWNYFSHVFSG